MNRASDEPIARQIRDIYLHLLWSCRVPLVRLALVAVLLAFTTAAHGALAGPALRLLFGGEALHWPASLQPYLPPPPALAVLRTLIPLVIVGLTVVKGGAGYVYGVGSTRLGVGVSTTLRGALQRSFFRLNPDEASRVGVGALSGRYLQDVEAVERLVIDGSLGRLKDFISVVALIVVCGVLDWQLAMLAFGVYPIVFFPLARLNQRLRRLARASTTETAALSAVVVDLLGRLASIRLQGAEIWAAEQLSVRLGEVARVRQGASRVGGLGPALAELMGALALAGTLSYAVWRVQDGALAPEQVISFFVALMLVYQPVKGLLRSHAALAPGWAALERLEPYLRQVESRSGDSFRCVSAPRIELFNLGVKRGEQEVLIGVNAVFLPNCISAIVGPNGSGKTSLMWVVAGLLPASSGTVLIDGRPIDALDGSDWRRCVGWVSQKTLLGRGSIRDNLLLGESVEEARIQLVLERVGLWSVITELPDGLETILGDDGAGLSGGEMQRLAVARALVRDPYVLVMDEAEAHLDATALDALCELIPVLAHGRTVLLISHSERLLALAHQRLVLTPCSE